MLESLLTGVVSGIVASILCFLITAFIKPKILISDCLRIRNKKGVVYYQLKVVNLSRAMLTDVQFSMFFRRTYPDGNIGAVSLCPVDQFCFMHKYKRNKRNTDYATRINYEIDQSKICLDDNTELFFSFYAKHSISKTPIYKEQHYTLKNIKDGLFEKGKSIEIVQS